MAHGGAGMATQHTLAATAMHAALCVRTHVPPFPLHAGDHDSPTRLPSPRPPRCCSGEWLELQADKVDVQLLGVAGEQLNSALTNPYFGML